MLTRLTALLALSTTLAAAQGAATLRIHVALTDASGTATPIPRLVLLVSDNPPTDEPRRVRTTADGPIELKLAPGSYLVELDEPVAFRGKAYTWTQIVEVAAGRDTLLDLTAANAEAAAGARINADSATLLTAWRDSIARSGRRRRTLGIRMMREGMIATSHHAGERNERRSAFYAGRTGQGGGKVIGSNAIPERRWAGDPERDVVRPIEIGGAAAAWQT